MKTSVADPDPRVFGAPGSGSISQRYGSGSWSIIIKQNPVLWLLFDFLPLKNYVKVPSKSIMQKNFKKNSFLLASWGQWWSGSISQRHRSADPDPHKNVMDAQHWWKQCSVRTRLQLIGLPDPGPCNFNKDWKKKLQCSYLKKYDLLPSGTYFTTYRTGYLFSVSKIRIRSLDLWIRGSWSRTIWEINGLEHCLKHNILLGNKNLTPLIYRDLAPLHGNKVWLTLAMSSSPGFKAKAYRTGWWAIGLRICCILDKNYICYHCYQVPWFTMDLNHNGLKNCCASKKFCSQKSFAFSTGTSY